MSYENIRPKIEEFLKRFKEGNDEEKMAALDEMLAFLAPIIQFQGDKADPGDVLWFLVLVLLSGLVKVKDSHDALKHQYDKEISELRKKLASLEGDVKVIQAKEFK
ncbi:MAG TPA: hypothetical protein VJP79_11360 [Nitrososphaera sp.]|nr:hypothetical protein [Nitrososphaera sp.]